jgi:transcriptional regulator with XRE-family HTH domain
MLANAEPSEGAKQWLAWLTGPPKRLQTQVAKELGFAQQTISQWSRGLVPSLENRLRIYKATGIDPSAWLTNGARDAEVALLKEFQRGKGKRSVAA